MESRQLVELAALVASHGPSLIRSRTRLSDSGLREYWTASKSRLDLWSRVLSKYRRCAALQDEDLQSAYWPQAYCVIEEILNSEVLTRVWTAVVTGYDHQRSQSEAEPIAHSIFVGHLEARNRALSVLALPSHPSAQEAIILNRLRKRCERWSDLLIGYLLQVCDVSELSHDKNRSTDFAEYLEHQRQLGKGDLAWQMALGSLQAVFHATTDHSSSHFDLNSRIAAGVVSCFPADMFDSTGFPQSLWLARMQNTTTDAQHMVDQLLLAELPPMQQTVS